MKDWDVKERKLDAKKGKLPVYKPKPASTKTAKRYVVTERIPTSEIGTDPKKDGTDVSYIRGSSVSTKVTRYGNNKIGALRDACPSLRQKRLRSCGYSEHEAKEMIEKRPPASVRERDVIDGSDYLRKQRENKKKIYATKKKKTPK